MPSRFLAAFAVSFLAASSPLAAQNQYAQFPAQDSDRFAGYDQGSIFAPQSRPVDQAALAIIAGRHADALALLQPELRRGGAVTRFLGAVAKEGLADFDGARLLYASALARRKNFIAAQAGLAGLEARHGDIAVANDLLGRLEARRAECGPCGDASALDASITAVQQALARRAL